MKLPGCCIECQYLEYEPAEECGGITYWYCRSGVKLPVKKNSCKRKRIDETITNEVIAKKFTKEFNSNPAFAKAFADEVTQDLFAMAERLSTEIATSTLIGNNEGE